MIIIFTARRRAVSMTIEQDSMAEFAVLNQMQGQDITRTIDTCMARLAAKAGVAPGCEAKDCVIKPSVFKVRDGLARLEMPSLALHWLTSRHANPPFFGVPGRPQ